MPPRPPSPQLPPHRRIVRSFGYAFQGLATIVHTQPNFWVHLVVSVAAIGLGLLMGLSPVEFAVLVLTIALVLVTESLNTALETMCDVVTREIHPMIKRAKDISAAAVLISACAAVVIAILIFTPRLSHLLGYPT